MVKLSDVIQTILPLMASVEIKAHYAEYRYAKCTYAECG
jgi:hypothetical protein